MKGSGYSPLSQAQSWMLQKVLTTNFSFSRDLVSLPPACISSDFLGLLQYLVII